MNDSPEDLACLYVLDRLDPAARAGFEARLLREPALAALVRDFESGLAAGVHALPRHRPSPFVLDRIEAQLDALPARAGRSVRPAFPARWAAFARWGLAAVIAVSLATLAVQSLRRPASLPMIMVGLDPDRSTLTELPLHEPAGDADARFMRLASLAQDFWQKPGGLPLQTPPQAGASRGYALFDPGSHQGFITIEQLPALTDNQRYHLWVADALTGRVRDAGILPLAGLNRGLYSFTLDPADNAPSARLRFFITIEEAGPADQPSRPRGRVVLGEQYL